MSELRLKAWFECYVDENGDIEFGAPTDGNDYRVKHATDFWVRLVSDNNDEVEGNVDFIAIGEMKKLIDEEIGIYGDKLKGKKDGATCNHCGKADCWYCGNVE